MGSRDLLGGSEISVIYEMHISWGRMIQVENQHVLRFSGGKKLDKTEK